LTNQLTLSVWSVHMVRIRSAEIATSPFNKVLTTNSAGKQQGVD